MKPVALYILLTTAVSMATIIPADRRIDWDPGVPGGIPDVPQACSVMDFGARGNGTADDFNAFQNAINSVTGSGAVYVPAGTYLIGSQLILKSGVVLRGAGAGATKLLFDVSNDDCHAVGAGGALVHASAIFIGKDSPGAWTDVTAGYTRGASQVTVANASSFSVGGFAEIRQDNDADVMYTDPKWEADWAAGSVGQMVKVTAKSGNTLTVQPALRHTYKSSLNPQMRKQECMTYAGVERLYMKLVGDGDISTVEFINAAYCWIRGCESDYSCKTHARFFASFRCEVRDSYFHHASDYGGGGHGYGVELDTHVSDCLVENNVFKHLRHSMLAQLGANGNVFGYNYSRENYTPDGFTPCDISLHGHFPYLNLYEGNVVQEIDVSDYWGPCGPGNTLLRNVVQKEGIDVLDESHGQNLVGNVVQNGDNIYVKSGVNSTLQHGNMVNGTVSWSSSISDRDIPDSYYHNAKPSFFGSTPWPVTGADLVPAPAKLPAQARYDAGAPVPGMDTSSVDTGESTGPDTAYVDGIGVIASMDDGNVAANVLDGDEETRWSAEGIGEWIQFDLGTSAAVYGVRIAFFRGDERSASFTVSVSSDGSTWTGVLGSATGSGATTSFEAFPFSTPVTARYVRITGNGNSENEWNSFTEVRIDTADGNVSGLHERSGMLRRNSRSVTRMFSIMGHRIMDGASSGRAFLLAYDRHGNICKVPFYGSAFRGYR